MRYCSRCLTSFGQGERNYLMQVVCEATQDSTMEVQVSAFECLVRIMGLYYDKMGFYMERALFGVSIVALVPTRIWNTIFIAFSSLFWV
jgi:hypothetical protein